MTTSMAEESVYEIQGWVADAQTGEPLVTVQVMVYGTDIGVITDLNGYFKIQTPYEKNVLVFMMAGYQIDTVSVNIKSKRAGKLFFYLKKKPYQYDPISVYGLSKKMMDSPLKLDMDIGILSSRPVLGEVDVFRLVQNFPGVAYTSDYSGLLYIRGSNFDQTQVTFDDVTILNPYHLGGMFSGFNADGIRSVQFSPGIVDAEYGGNLGGRLNMIPKNGTESQRYHAKVSFGLLTSKITYGNRIGKSSFFFTARRSYFDLIESILSGEVGPYYFIDGQAGFQYKINGKSNVSLNLFYSKDYLTNMLEADEINQNNLEEPSWGNRIISLKWKLNPGQNSLLISQLYFSSSNAFSNTNHIDIDNRLECIGWRVSYKRNSFRHYFSTGFDVSRTLYQGSWSIIDAVKLGNLTRPPEYIFFDYAPAKYRYRYLTPQIILFSQYQYEISSLSRVQLGLRNGWTGLEKRIFCEPRLQMKRFISSNVELIATLARQEQHFYSLKTVQNSDIFAPFSAYFPVQEGEEPLSSNYLSAGLIWGCSKDITLRMEGYGKWMNNIPTISQYRSHNKVYQKQEAAGLDVFIEREKQKGMNYSIAYSLCFARIVDRERSYPASFNRRHNLKMEFSYISESGWQFGLRGFYLSGLPYTPLLGKFIGGGTKDDEEIVWFIDWNNEYSGDWGLVKGSENSARFPPYHRLDVDISKVWYFNRSRLWIKLQVINAYNRKNPAEYRWEIYSNQTIRDDMFNLPLIPSIEIIYEF